MVTQGSLASAAGLETLSEHSMVGEFEILGILGEGGFGTVYLAMDHSLDRKVALKEYRPAALATRTGTTVVLRSQKHAEAFAAGLKSFINEARTLARFDHPALVRVYRFWQDNGTAYMAMPLYSGQTLTQYVRDRRDQVDEAWLKHLLVPLLDAIEALHGVQIFHRDIAPDNVVIRENGMPILLDFGAAREIQTDMTQALTVILKPGYAPVEQYAEDDSMKQGPWTDIYALGAVMYFAVTGRAPTNSVTRLVNDSLVPLVRAAPAGYSPAFLNAIDHALAVRPTDRPQSIAELRALFGFPAHRPMVKTRDDAARKAEAAPGEPGSTTVLAQADSGSIDPQVTVILPHAKERAAEMTRQVQAAPAAATRAQSLTQQATLQSTQPLTQPPTQPATQQAPPPATQMPAQQSAQPVTQQPAQPPTQAGQAAQDAAAGPRKRPVAMWIAGGAVAVIVAVVAGRALLPTGPAPGGTAGTPAAGQPAADKPAAGSTPALTGSPADAKAPPAAQTPAQTPAGAPAGTQPAGASAKDAGAAPAPGQATPPAAADAAGTAAAGEAVAPPPVVTGTGTLRLDVKPWATVKIDGEEKGVSPPLKSVKLPVGKHVVEFSNSAFPSHTAEIEVEKDKRIALSYEFK